MGAIQNLSPTPMKPANVSYWEMVRGMLKRNVNRSPGFSLPSVKPVFNPVQRDQYYLVWSFFLSHYKSMGLNILVDPVFCATPSPFPFMGFKNFKGTDFIHPEDLPDLDIILITHDHYDHLDYQSILKLSLKLNCLLPRLALAHTWNIGMFLQKK